MIACQGSTQAQLRNAPISIRAQPWVIHERRTNRAIALGLSQFAASSLATRATRSGQVAPRGRTDPGLAGTSTQPRAHQSHPHRSHQLTADKNMSDDVSANKSLNGNERETPSTQTPPGLARVGIAQLPGWKLVPRLGLSALMRLSALGFSASRLSALGSRPQSCHLSRPLQWITPVSGQEGVIGELLSFGECFVHYRPHNTPRSLNPPGRWGGCDGTGQRYLRGIR
jgi:hypothetical protein